MVALKDYDELINAALESKVDAIISGAGLPLRLPELVKDHDVLIAPIVSSGKARKGNHKTLAQKKISTYTRFYCY